MAGVLPLVADCCDECGPCDVDVTVAETAIGIFYRDTIADLRAIATASTNLVCIVAGDITAGDGFGGMWFWVNTGTTADDGINYIRPDDYSTAGLWQKML